ncbi:MAG: oligosaccharyl transferase, archaeosortase A system-associated [Candidatus Methanoperedens sp.]|nr:oligosaccharyl transferase, archaeosortase A system-associated [Candidatus Methanoperedens sp.]
MSLYAKMTIWNKIRPESKTFIFLFLILLIGFKVRLFTFSQVFEPGRVVFLEADPYYHMWRVFSYIETFPGTFFFDPFLNFPYGAAVGWPPLSDQSIALVSLIAGSGNPGTYLVEIIGAFTPVFTGIISIISVYYIAKEIFNERAGLYSSLLLAVMPAHAQISFVGFVDHHILEVLISVIAYLFFMRSLKNDSYRFSILSGIMIGLSFLTWIGAPIFIGIILSYVIIQFIIDKKSNVDSNYLLKTGIISFSIAFFTILLFYLWIPWQKNLQAGVLSYFQLMYVFFGAIIVVFLGIISRFMKGQKWIFYPLILIVIFASFFFMMVISLPSFYENLLNSIGYLLRDASAIKQVIEAQPLFYTYDGIFLGWRFFSNPVWYQFSFSFYFAIIGFFLLIYYSRRGADKGTLFLIIWTLLVVSLALSQRRFTYMLAVNVAILSGFLLDKVALYSCNTGKFKTFHLKSDYIALFILTILVIPNSVMAYNMAQSPPKISDDWYDSLVWLRDNTPDPGRIPQYGVMAWWDYGNWILYISKRPVVANNFQIGGDEAARFFTEDNEILANEIMDKRKARYVVMDMQMGLNKFSQGDQVVIKGTFFGIANLANKDIGMYFDKNNFPNNNYFQTMYSKMHVFDGAGLKNYRMIYESKEMHYDIFDNVSRDIKIFEYVMGARIIGNATSNESVMLSGTIITNQKRRFEYTQKNNTDENGYFEFIVPYSKESPYRTKLLEGFTLKYDNITRSINVSEKDILNGNTISVN